MIIRPLKWPNILTKFRECARDERGTAMTEYILISAVTAMLAIYLFHPDNGFYEGAREQYELTSITLMFPGP
jgi:hypothetical protein